MINQRSQAKVPHMTPGFVQARRVGGELHLESMLATSMIGMVNVDRESQDWLYLPQLKDMLRPYLLGPGRIGSVILAREMSPRRGRSGATIAGFGLLNHAVKRQQPELPDEFHLERVYTNRTDDGYRAVLGALVAGCVEIIEGRDEEEHALRLTDSTAIATAGTDFLVEVGFGPSSEGTPVMMIG